MVTLYLILLVLAAVFFAIHAFGLVVGKVNFLGLGLLSWVLVEVIKTTQNLT